VVLSFQLSRVLLVPNIEVRAFFKSWYVLVTLWEGGQEGGRRSIVVAYVEQRVVEEALCKAFDVIVDSSP
jgi:hypothetical protein